MRKRVCHYVRALGERLRITHHRNPIVKDEMLFQTKLSLGTCALIACMTTFGISGCGNTPPAIDTNASASPSPSITQPTSTPTIESNSFTNEERISKPSATTEDTSSPIAQAPNGDPQPTDKQKAEDTGDTTTQVASPVMPKPQEPTVQEPTVQEPKPTAEQLARWKQPEFEPLVLLARHQSEELAFVSHAVSSADGAWLVLGGEKLTLWKPLETKPVATLWDLKSDGESKSIKSLAIDPTGKWIAAGDAQGTLRLWSLSDQKDRGTQKVHDNAVAHIAISDDGKEIATATYGKTISIWQTKNIEPKKTFDIDTIGLQGLTYAGPGKLAIAGQSLTIWDTTTGLIDKTLVEDGYVASLSRASDRSLFAFAEEKNLRFLKSDDLSVAAELLGSFARNEILRLTTDGKFLWTANGSSIRGWDLASGQVVQNIDVNKPQVIALDWIDKLSLLRVVTEDGAIRYWGTIASGLAVGLKPLHPKIEIPEGHDTPTTAFELQSMVDLRTIPKPPDSISTSGEMTMLQIDSGNSSDDTLAFYRHVFGQRGWKELPAKDTTPDYLAFNKNGFKVFIGISDADAGRKRVYLTSLGNVDLRTIPRLDLAGFKLSFESDSNVSYEVDADLLTIETELLRKFSTSGWIPYARLNSSHNNDPSSRNFEFIRNAMTIRVNVQPKPGSTKHSVQYNTFVAPSHLPVPDDCSFIECDAAQPPAIVAKTSLALEDCQAFYDQAMSKLGWLASGVVKSKDGDRRWLTYFHDQIDVQIQLRQAETNGTWIIVGEYAEQNSWQLRQKDAPGLNTDNPNSSGFQAADIPIFKASEATAVNYDKQQERLEIKLPKNSHVEIVDFYAAKLETLGWKEEPNGFRDEDYAFVTFAKDKASIEVRVNSSSLGTTIGISGDGLLWDKALPEPTAVISYESWMRKNSYPASLEMLDQYIDEMRPLLKK